MEQCLRGGTEWSSCKRISENKWIASEYHETPVHIPTQLPESRFDDPFDHRFRPTEQDQTVVTGTWEVSPHHFYIDPSSTVLPVLGRMRETVVLLEPRRPDEGGEVI